MVNNGLKREFLLLFLLLCIGVTSVNVADGYFIKVYNMEGAEKTNEIVIRNNREDFGIDSEMEIFFMEYFTLWFDAVSELKEKDISIFFDKSDQSGEISSIIDQNVLSFLIAMRQYQDNDLRINDYICGVTYQSLEILENGDIKVALKEDNHCRFAFTPNIDSISTGITHVFVIRKTEDGYSIVYHEKEEDSYLLFSPEWDKQMQKKSDFKQVEVELLSMKESFLKQAKIDLAQLKIKKEIMQPVVEKKIQNLKPYKPEQAVDYAMRWIDPTEVIRNDQWESYDRYDGNCNNFISQCLNAGEIPMDFIGNWQWKYFGDDVDNGEWPVGRSSSWTGVEEFYEYAKNNKNKGLLADTDANPSSGEPGDILQYGINDDWKHSVIIVNVIKDENGKTVDYLINSNTTDRINYPASAYAYPNQRLIKILGYGI
ncbi:MAG: amidase domain-containing protein [Eubacterium sp.]